MESSPRILNDFSPDSDCSKTTKEELLDPIDVSRLLHRKILRLKREFLKSDGFKLDYKEIRQSPEFQVFQIATRQLNLLRLNALSRNAGKAFFLNVYNTLTIHALIVQVEDQKSLLELEGFWQRNAYKIGGLIYTLDDIEHGILRCNKLHPTTKEHFLKEGDPRLEFVQPSLDPRIHFALNCGAQSCPPIRLFSLKNIDSGLELASQNFCQNEICIDVDTKTVRLTKIFIWYAQDFGPDEKSILTWLIRYLTKAQAAALRDILDESPTIEYTEYDWTID